MAIKRFEAQTFSATSFRPRGFQYPVGLTFLGSGTGNVIASFADTGTWVCPTGVTEVEYLVVAGGGGGGHGIGLGGGGGAGGYLTGTGHPVTPGTPYTITVGAGGAGGVSDSGTNGANSVFD